MHKIKPTLLHLQKGAQRLLSHFFRLPFFFTLKQLETSVTNRVYQPQEGSLAIVFSATLHHSLGFLEQIIEREKSSLRVWNKFTVDEGEESRVNSQSFQILVKVQTVVYDTRWWGVFTERVVEMRRLCTWCLYVNMNHACYFGHCRSSWIPPTTTNKFWWRKEMYFLKRCVWDRPCH